MSKNFSKEMPRYGVENKDDQNEILKTIFGTIGDRQDCKSKREYVQRVNDVIKLW